MKKLTILAVLLLGCGDDAAAGLDSRADGGPAPCVATSGIIDDSPGCHVTATCGADTVKVQPLDDGSVYCFPSSGGLGWFKQCNLTCYQTTAAALVACCDR